MHYPPATAHSANRRDLWFDLCIVLCAGIINNVKGIFMATLRSGPGLDAFLPTLALSQDFGASLAAKVFTDKKSRSESDATP